MKKRVIKSILFSLLALGVIVGAALAQEPLEITYPDLLITGFTTPTTVKITIVEYFRYIFTFVLILSGIVVFGSAVAAGIAWLTSGVNPSALTDSKDRLMSSFLGGILLLSSYLLLNSINPQLTIMKIPGIVVDKAIKIFPATSIDPEDAEYIKGSRANLTSFGPGCVLGSPLCGVRRIEFVNIEPAEVSVKAYSDINYEGTMQEISISGDLVGLTAKSIEIGWRLPGVYLHSEPNNILQTAWKGEARLYLSSQADLGDFDNKAQSLRTIIPRSGVNCTGASCCGNGLCDKNETALGCATDCGRSFAAVLHKDPNFQKDCAVILSSLGNLDEEYPAVGWGGGIVGNEETSSITVFRPDLDRTQSGGEGVILTDKNNTSTIRLHRVLVGDITFLGGLADNSVRSIETRGDYITILFEKTNFEGFCEVFAGANKTDDNLADNPIGRCWAGGACPCIPIIHYCFTCRWPCASSVIILPTRP